MTEPVVVDASATVDLLFGNELGNELRARLVGHDLHAPPHLDAEVLSTSGRLHRGGRLTAGSTVAEMVVP